MEATVYRVKVILEAHSIVPVESLPLVLMVAAEALCLAAPEEILLQEKEAKVVL
jgi:hypothetical protein